MDEPVKKHRRGLAVLPNGRVLSYRVYLDSPAWRDVRKRYKQSDLRQKCHCGESRVQLHHKTYKRLGHERLTDLVPLCSVHHAETHNVHPPKPGKLWTAHKRTKSARRAKRKKKQQPQNPPKAKKKPPLKKGIGTPPALEKKYARLREERRKARLSP